jgi:uncharacterized protein YndB with AHSA1/START domain
MAANEERDRFQTYAERVSDRELVMRRVFRAPRQTVFDAMTKAELVRRWWAPRSLGVTLFECTIDPRVGGTYRYVFGPEGKPPVAFSGVFREVVPGARVVYTQIFEPMRHVGEGLITATYTETDDGFTSFEQHELYPSKEVLDGAIASGMERGMRATLDQLAALLAELE